MVIKVVEKCMHDNSRGKHTGTRTYLYEVEGATDLEGAVQAYKENFDADNILRCNENFLGGCLDSYVYSFTFYSEN